MTVILNCRTIETAMTTVAEVVGMPVADLRRRLRAIEVPSPEEPREYIASKLLAASIDTLPRPSSVHWFHASRVLYPDAFKHDGILTKTAANERLLPLLRDLSNGLVAHGRYCNSGSVAAKSWINDEGPFGFLLRSDAAEPETHFFRAPESVEDIAGSLLGGNFLALVDRYQACSVPCLVEFKAPGSPYYVAHALWYVYLVEAGLPDAAAAKQAGTCFDGGGTAIPAYDVVDVELLPVETGRLRPP